MSNQNVGPVAHPRPKASSVFLNVWMDDGSAFDLESFDDLPSAQAKFTELLKAVRTAEANTVIVFRGGDTLRSFTPSTSDVVSALYSVESRLETISDQLPGH